MRNHAHSLEKIKLRHLCVGVVLVAGALSSACDESDTFSLLRPDLEVTPDPGTRLEFDQVVLTRTKVGPVRVQLKNLGPGPLTVDSFRIEGPGANAFVITQSPSLIIAGQTKEVVVRFDPVSPGDHEATLVFTTNDTDLPTVSYPIGGNAREPCVLFADQSRLSFLAGDTHQVKLTSLSSHACVIDRLFVDRSLFPILEEPPVPFTVPGGGSVTLTLQHIAAATAPGVPVRELLIRESEGSELLVLLEGEAPLSGCLTAFPTEIVFPQTERGQTRRQRVQVTNRCPRAATIASVVVSRAWAAFAIDDTYPQIIPPGDSLDVWIKYVPQTEYDLGRVTINTNDASNPRIRVLVQGTAALPGIEAFPYSLDFGTVVYRSPAGMSQRSECGSGARILNIFSTGSAPLSVSRFEMEGSGDQLFEVTGVRVDGNIVSDFAQGFSIPPNQSAEVALQFYPTRDTPANHNSNLIIHHDGGDQVPVRVGLKGIGGIDGPVQDRFTQLVGPKVDILWVIDNSCSMYDEQARLVDNLSEFITYADSQNADYQMGVIVTDSRSSNAGKLEFCYPHPRIVRHDYTDREEAFRCLFEVGVNGSYIEAGLGAAMRALQRALRVNDDPIRNPNIGFLRDDASLAIVAMSDEDDQSLESDNLLLRFFQTVKPNTRTRLHSIAGPVAEPCITRRAAPGYRYNWMTDQMGGLFQNICQEDWQPVLRNLGLNVFVPLEEWELSQPAQPASLMVTVAGQAIIRDPQQGYSYDASRNIIRFHGVSVPEPGEEILVDYVNNCRP
jgi:hypothetical protein